MKWTHGMNSWNGLMGMDSWNGLMEWIHGMDSWNGLMEWIHGMDSWNGLMEWTGLVECMYGPVEWNHGMDDLFISLHKIRNLAHAGMAQCMDVLADNSKYEKQEVPCTLCTP